MGFILIMLNDENTQKAIFYPESEKPILFNKLSEFLKLDAYNTSNYYAERNTATHKAESWLETLIRHLINVRASWSDSIYTDKATAESLVLRYDFPEIDRKLERELNALFESPYLSPKAIYQEILNVFEKYRTMVHFLNENYRKYYDESEEVEARLADRENTIINLTLENERLRKKIDEFLTSPPEKDKREGKRLKTRMIPLLK
jgi:hypothetical protein